MGTLAESQLAEIEERVVRYLSDRDEMEALSPEEFEERMERDDMRVLDVRPEEAYEAGHIPGARSIPVNKPEEHLEERPDNKDIVAYCRGPYCVYSDDAVRRHRENGRDALRFSKGLSGWFVEGRPVANDTE